MSDDTAQSQHQPTILTVGNFDGVHLGHQRLITQARQLANRFDQGQVIALVFDPHPSTVLSSSDKSTKARHRLMSFEQRTRHLRQVGVDKVVRLRPTEALLNLTPEAFIDRLACEFHMAGMVEGSDFCFGRNRSGTVDCLRSLGETHGFSVEIVSPVETDLDNQCMVVVSSSQIRHLLTSGRVRDAARLLGRPHSISGTVKPGQSRGRTIGIPTANLETVNLLPGRGVYAGRATIRSGQLKEAPDSSTIDQEHLDSTYPAAINIGLRPTFEDQGRLVCEIHLIGFKGEIGQYDWPLEVEFHAFLRPEIAFDNVDQVKAQIWRDVARVEQMLLPSSSEKIEQPST